MSDKWLVKFAAKQPTAEIQLRQQIEALPLEDLHGLVGPNSTENIDSFQEKAASAIGQGRLMAHEFGPQLVEKTAQETAESRALIEAIGALSDEDAIKVAHVLENGSDVEKVAVVGNLMSMAGKGLKAVGGFAAKRPAAAAAIGGAGVGALMGGEGNRIGGALGGAALAGGAAKMSPAFSQKIRNVGFGAGLHGQNLINKGMAKVAEEVQALYKRAMLSNCSDSANSPSWLGQFEGSPLLEQAIALAEQELQLDIQRIQTDQARREAFKDDDIWIQRDIVQSRKRLLELQLISQRNGLGQQQAQEEEPAPQPQAQPQQPQPQGQPPQGVGGPGGVQMPLQKQAGIGDILKGIGSGAARTVAKPIAHAADALDPMARGKLPGYISGEAGKAIGSAGALVGVGALGHHIGSKDKKAGVAGSLAGSASGLVRPLHSVGAAAGRGAAGGMIGGAIGGALKTPGEGETRLGNAAQTAGKGLLIGGGIGAGYGALRNMRKVASIPFVPRR